MKIAITMGDSSGVGPEILLRCHGQRILPANAVVYGEASILEYGAERLNLDIEIHRMLDTSDVESDALNVISMDQLRAGDLTPGRLSAKAGAAAHLAITAAVRDAIEGRVDGIVTLPMNKQATAINVPDFTGHTELIAGQCRADDFSMMLATEQVAVNHVSTHVSLRSAIESLSAERVLKSIALLHEVLRHLKPEPRLAVCGLNPHAGESGLFGDEEHLHIAPAIEAARAADLCVTGPVSADTVFRQAIHLDRFDGIVCIYHDQGHAPMKLWAFDSAVNVTLGLPFVRTSVDHGTAFDIAWTGQASTKSLSAAIAYAQKLIAAGYPSTWKKPKLRLGPGLTPSHS